MRILALTLFALSLLCGDLYARQGCVIEQCVPDFGVGGTPPTGTGDCGACACFGQFEVTGLTGTVCDLVTCEGEGCQIQFSYSITCVPLSPGADCSASGSKVEAGFQSGATFEFPIFDTGDDPEVPSTIYAVPCGGGMDVTVSHCTGGSETLDFQCFDCFGE